MIVEAVSARTHGHTGGSLGLGSLRLDPASDRVKGFHNRLLTPDTLPAFVAELRDARQANSTATRLTARALARKEVLPLLREVYDGITSTGLVEATIPVDREHSIVYVGINSPERLVPVHVQVAQAEILRNAQGATPVSREQALARVTAKGYSLAIIDRDRIERHVDSLVQLFGQAYPKYLLEIDAAAVRDMVSGSNVFFAAVKDGVVCSVVVAEHGVVEVGGFGPLVLRELSEYATERQHGGNGLNIALQHMAIDNLRSSGENSVIFAEGRAPWTAVIRSMVRAGLVHGGTLRQHCTLVSVRDTAANYDGNYEDLHVFYPGAN